MNPNAQYDALEKGKQQLLALSEGLTKGTLTPNVITPQVLAPQKPITLPPAPAPVEPTGVVSRATSLQQSLAAQQQKAAEDAKLQIESVKADKTGLRSRIDQLFQGTLGRGEEQQQLEAQAGIPQQQKELADLIERTTVLNNAFNTAYNVSENRLAPMVAITGEQAAIRRQQAVEIGNLSALAQAKQGNIQMAKDTIKETLDYKYADAKAQVEYELSALDALGEDLTKAEQAQKEARQALLQSQLQEIEVARAEEETVQNYAVEAAKNGADNQTLEAIRKARTVDEAIALASPFIGKLQRDQQSFENNLALQKFNEDKRRYGIETALEAAKLTIESQQSNMSAITGKPLSEGERVSLGYANRIQESNLILNTIGDQFAGVSNYAKQYLPNVFKSEEQQKFEQAQRNFINAVLRRESGAVISDQEFDNARQQYFPQPGDAPATLRQKAQNRKQVEQNFLIMAGQSPASQGQQVKPEELRAKYQY